MGSAYVPLVANQPLNANFSSQQQQLRNVFGYSIQAVITGVATGTAFLQASSDPVIEMDAPYQIPINWTSIECSAFVVAGDDSLMWNVTGPQYNWVRLVYVDGSLGTSTATMSVSIDIKGF